MPFKTELIVRPIRGTGARELLVPLVYQAADGKVFFVVRGFVTDYASIPQFLRSWIDQDSGHIREAAVLHDYLYATPGHLRVDRAQADGYFYEAMRDLGMPYLRAKAAWLAVRMFGGKYWK